MWEVCRRLYLDSTLPGCASLRHSGAGTLGIQNGKVCSYVLASPANESFSRRCQLPLNIFVSLGIFRAQRERAAGIHPPNQVSKVRVQGGITGQ